MHSSSWRRAPTSYIASFCRARLRRFAAHLCKATAAHLRPLLPAALHTKLADSKTHCKLQHLNGRYSECELRQASPPTSHHGGLTTGQKWAIALGAVLFGMAVKVCARCSHAVIHWTTCGPIQTPQRARGLQPCPSKQFALTLTCACAVLCGCWFARRHYRKKKRAALHEAATTAGPLDWELEIDEITCACHHTPSGQASA
jgi:hypothetical protein